MQVGCTVHACIYASESVSTVGVLCAYDCAGWVGVSRQGMSDFAFP